VGAVVGVRPVQARPADHQIDGLHIGNDLVLVAALGDKHPLGLVEGATGKYRYRPGADRQSDRARSSRSDAYSIIDGAKALSRVIRRRWRLGPYLKGPPSSDSRGRAITDSVGWAKEEARHYCVSNRTRQE
jgi:hypothetical protein